MTIAKKWVDAQAKSGTRRNRGLLAKLRTPEEIRAAGTASRLHSQTAAKSEAAPDQTGYLRIMGLLLRSVASPTMFSFLRRGRRA